MIIFLASLAALILGYLIYGTIVARIFGADDQRPTPVTTMEDGVDFVHLPTWKIFLIQLLNIAGVGPIFGPILGALYGPVALVWIVIGSIFAGGVHDYFSGMLSVRSQGESIPEVVGHQLGGGIKLFMRGFSVILLLLVGIVFVSSPAQLLTNITPLPISVLTAIIFAYYFLATMLPIDKIIGRIYPFFAGALIFMAVGLIITLALSGHQFFPQHTLANINPKKLPLWPLMFITIACGAISGFHSLVAGGTTSKQLPNERYIKRIGYGGMIMEGVLSILTVTAVGAGLYWAGENIPGHLIYPEIMKKEGWIVAFGAGYGEITKPIFGPLGVLIGIMMLKTFVLTTLDSATRITRYMGEELFGEGLKIKILRNRFASTAVIIALAAWLALGNWKAIWPVFGAANQLVAALGLLIASVYLLNKKKKAVYTLVPGIFMLLTTIAALLYEAQAFFRGGKFLLGAIALILLVLAAFVVYESAGVIKLNRTRWKGKTG